MTSRERAREVLDGLKVRDSLDEWTYDVLVDAIAAALEAEFHHGLCEQLTIRAIRDGVDTVMPSTCPADVSKKAENVDMSPGHQTYKQFIRMIAPGEEEIEKQGSSHAMAHGWHVFSRDIAGEEGSGGYYPDPIFTDGWKAACRWMLAKLQEDRDYNDKR